jgi:hypothetical protein
MVRKSLTTDKTTRLGQHIAEQMKRIRKKPYVKVGILAEEFKEAKKSDDDGRKKKSKSRPATLGEVAVYNEFGTSDGRIPERSFIRWTHDHKKKEWIRRTAQLRKRVMQGELTTDQALGLMGEMIQKDIKDRILSNVQPANKPATVARKTRDGKSGNKTLIDTTQMLGSVHWSKHDGSH